MEVKQEQENSFLDNVCQIKLENLVTGSYLSSLKKMVGLSKEDIPSTQTQAFLDPDHKASNEMYIRSIKCEQSESLGFSESTEGTQVSIKSEAKSETFEDEETKIKVKVEIEDTQHIQNKYCILERSETQAEFDIKVEQTDRDDDFDSNINIKEDQINTEVKFEDLEYEENPNEDLIYLEQDQSDEYGLLQTEDKLEIIKTLPESSCKTEPHNLQGEGRTEDNDNVGEKESGEVIVTEEIASGSPLKPPKAKSLKRKMHLPPDIDQKMDEAYKVFKNITNTQTSPPDQCSLYGKLLATKLRVLDADTREMAMIEIDLLVYRLKHRHNESSKEHFGHVNLQNGAIQSTASFSHNLN